MWNSGGLHHWRFPLGGQAVCKNAPVVLLPGRGDGIYHSGQLDCHPVSRVYHRGKENDEKNEAVAPDGRPALAGVGLAMMVFGVYRGEVEQVFTKGIQICLECIGIG